MEFLISLIPTDTLTLVGIMIGTLLVMIAAGVPIAVSLAGASLVFIALSGRVPEIVVIHRMVNGIDSFPLLAIPFFIMAGNIMNSAGITRLIYDFALALVGWMKGGLGHVNVAGSVIFAGMSGTAVADAGGLGTIEIRAMREHGYPVKFAVGLTAASATVGPIIPPSLPLVVYGVVANASIGQLFVAGIVPGLLMALMMSLTVAFFAHTQGWGRDQRFSFRFLGKATVHAILPMMTPVIIIGGMMGGLFTPTEAAIFACAYALFLGVIAFRIINRVRLAMGLPKLYPEMSWRQFVRVSFDTIETTAVVMLIVSAAAIFGWILTSTQVTDQLAQWLLSLSRDPLVLLFLINLLLLIVGCFMETIAAITILTPVLLPVLVSVGVDPIQFGIIMVLNLMIGLLTPPVGMVLYVLSRVSGLSFEETVKACLPFLIPLLLALVLITVFPIITLWLPTALYR